MAAGIHAEQAELTGFVPFRREGLEVDVQTFLVLDVVLHVGGIEETVTVTGETPLIETANANVASPIDKAQLDVPPTPRRTLFIMSVKSPNVLHTGDPVFVRQQDQTNCSLRPSVPGPFGATTTRSTVWPSPT